MRGLLLAAMLSCGVGGGAVAEVIAQPPRMHGWWIGDVLTHRAILIPPAGQVIDAASLPRPRALNYWLNLTAMTTEDIEGGVIVTTTWQVFYSPLEPSLREVPAYSVSLVGAGDATRLDVPGWSFVVSPLRPILASNSPEEMAPDLAIAAAPASGKLNATLGFGLLSVLSLAALAWHQAWPPFRTRPGRPFAAAARRVARGKGDPRAMALALHRGLDAAHGAPLLAADLPVFLAASRDLAPLSDRLAEFFERSSKIFFGDANPGEGDAAMIAALARDLAAIEGGRA